MSPVHCYCMLLKFNPGPREELLSMTDKLKWSATSHTSLMWSQPNECWLAYYILELTSKLTTLSGSQKKFASKTLTNNSNWMVLHSTNLHVETRELVNYIHSQHPFSPPPSQNCQLSNYSKEMQLFNCGECDFCSLGLMMKAKSILNVSFPCVSWAPCEITPCQDVCIVVVWGCTVQESTGERRKKGWGGGGGWGWGRGFNNYGNRFSERRKWTNLCGWWCALG